MQYEYYSSRNIARADMIDLHQVMHLESLRKLKEHLICLISRLDALLGLRIYQVSDGTQVLAKLV